MKMKIFILAFISLFFVTSSPGQEEIFHRQKFRTEDPKCSLRDIFNNKTVEDNTVDQSALGDDTSKILYESRYDPEIETYYSQIFQCIEEREEGPSTVGTWLHLHRARITLYADYIILYEETRTPAETSALLDKYAKVLSLETRAEIYRKLRRYEAAISDLTKALEITERKDNCLMKRGDLYIIIEHFDNAIADYETAKAINEDEDFQRYADEKIKEVTHLIHTKRQSTSL